MPKYSCIEEAITDNQKRPCKVLGCARNRHRISGYCRYHNNVIQTHGHPEHRSIRAPDYRSTMKEVKTIIQQNPDHNGVLLGLKFFRDLLSNPRGLGYRAGQPELIFRLSDYGVKEVDLLGLSAALYVMYMNQNYKLKSQKHFIYQLGYLVLTIIPRRGITIRGTTKRNLGQFIYDNLKTLFASVFEAIKKQEMRAEFKANAFSTPLSID